MRQAESLEELVPGGAAGVRHLRHGGAARRAAEAARQPRARRRRQGPTVLRRLQEYEERTLPLIDFYKRTPRFHRIDGFRDVDAVQQDLREPAGEALVSVQKSWPELQKMARACRIVVDTLDVLEQAAVPGVTTKELDRIAREHIEKEGAKPAFLGYRGYPASLCVAVNDAGRARDPERPEAQGRRHRRARPGLRRGRLLRGRRAHGGRGPDRRRGPPPHEGDAGGARRGDRGRAGRASAWATSGTRSRRHAEKHGYSVVREFVGHGIGTRLHEEPQVPNYGPPGRRERLVPGMCLAIEPMVNAGSPRGGDDGRRLDRDHRGRQPLRPLRVHGGGDAARARGSSPSPTRTRTGKGGAPCLRRRWW